MRIFSFSLGVAAILFVGIAFGSIHKRLSLPEYTCIIGLVLSSTPWGFSPAPVSSPRSRSGGSRSTAWPLRSSCPCCWGYETALFSLGAQARAADYVPSMVILSTYFTHSDP
jgi:hypothetical protein